jgi:hypothetical protein
MPGLPVFGGGLRLLLPIKIAQGELLRLAWVAAAAAMASG